jgi:hypothetical protein
MTALTRHSVEAADSLALARLDDDGAPAAETTVISHGGAKTAQNTPGAAAGAPTAALPSARISFDPALIRHGAVDGGWWPRSRNALTELPGLIVALDARPGVRVQRLAVHRDEWDDIPRQLTDNGHFVRIDWFTTIPRHTVSVTTARGREPIALLVVPPGTPAGAARAAMTTAATGPGTAQAADILTAEEGPRAPVSTGRSSATARAKGRHI